MVKDTIDVKFFALLHDPPWKPWSITNKSGRVVQKLLESMGKSDLYEERDKAHESEAFTIAKVISEVQEVDKVVYEIVHRADTFSSSLDRFLTPYEKEKIEVPRYKLNIFDPDLKYEILEPKNIEGFVGESFDLYPRIKDKRLRYNVLYTSLELLWYKYNPKSFPVADTRVPTHSVFDHMYSTATVSNWFLEGDTPSGYLVRVDIPGIQQVIGKARKATDLWAGSWILSYLMYKTMEPFIMEYGADVVLNPFIGFNPFLISSLLHKVSETDKGLADRLKKLYPEILQTPYQPVMPATVSLALPKLVGDVKTKVKENYKAAWRAVIDALGKGVSAVLVEAEDYPIMPLRVYVLDVGEKYREFKGKIGDLDKTLKGQLEELRNQSIETPLKSLDLMNLAKPLFLEYLLKEVGDKNPMKVFYGLNFAPKSNGITTDKYTRGKNYRVCTSCGTLPAVVGGEKKSTEEPEVEVKDPKNVDEGEVLCHYCHTKRLMGRSNKKELLEKLGFYTTQGFDVVPSTIDIANLGLWKKVLQKAEVSHSKKSVTLPSPLKDYEKVGEVFYLSDDERILMKLLDSRKAEKAIEELKAYINDEKFLRSLRNEVKTYYAIVKGDADYIGSKLSHGVIKTSLPEYVRKTRLFYEDKKRGEKDEEQLSKVLDILVKLMNWLGIGLKETVKESFNGIPVTPVYLIALSRSLAVTAIRDANAVSKDGVLIYAGGDDVMFLSPVERSLDLVRETRSHYWGNPVGFHVLDELYFAVLDAQPLYGRSYGVLIAHYKDAVYNLWDLAGQMEEMKDEIKVGGEKSEGETKKDVTIVLRGRGISGLRDAAILYNYPVLEGSGVYKSLRLRTFEVFDKLRESLSGSKDKLSKSFVKDWLSLDEDEFREFTNDAISYLIRNNSMSKWRETKLKELYDSLTGLNLKLVWEGDNKERDERTELIKTYDYLEV